MSEREEQPEFGPDPKRLDQDASIRDFLSATITAGARQLVRHDPGVRLGSDPEAVHRARVATRRLRSDLKSFGSLVSADTVGELRDELAWFGGLLGLVRDPQVLEQRLTERAASLEAAGGLDESAASDLTELLVERARFHHAQLVDAMGGDRYDSLVADLVAMSEDPPTASPKIAAKTARPVVERLARREWKRARTFAEGLGPDPGDVALHEVRKRLKRARYAAQSVKRLGVGSKQFRRDLADVQDRLGDHHDLVVQREFLAADLDRLGPESAFVAGRLLQDADRQRSEMRDEWPRLARRLARLDFD